MTITEANLDDLSSLAQRAAHEAGRLVGRASIRSLRASVKSSPTDFVTEMDRASERLILEIILTARPDDGLIGEEGTSTPSHGQGPGKVI